MEEEGIVYYTLNSATGVITIEEQSIFTTEYNGAPYDYTVSGTGILDEENGTLNIHYNLFQDGWSVDGYWYGAVPLATPYFESNLARDKYCLISLKTVRI